MEISLLACKQSEDDDGPSAGSQRAHNDRKAAAMMTDTDTRSTRCSRALIIAAMLIVPSWTTATSAGTSDVFISASGASGSGTMETGIPCTEGGDGTTWLYDYSTTTSAGASSLPPGDLDLHLEVNGEPSGDPAVYSAGWLQASGNHVTIANDRGTAVLELTSGTCENPSLTLDGSRTSGSGTWTVEGTGSYRQATGSGTFVLDATLLPGVENPFTIDVAGTVTVLDPALEVDILRARWDPPRGPSEFRNATVTYLVTNVGLGDAYGVHLNGVATSPSAVVPLSSLPLSLGDLAAGEVLVVELNYQVAQGRCEKIDRGCAFDSTLSFDVPDALDRPAPHEETESVRVPQN